MNLHAQETHDIFKATLDQIGHCAAGLEKISSDMSTLKSLMSADESAFDVAKNLWKFAQVDEVICCVTAVMLAQLQINLLPVSACCSLLLFQPKRAKYV